MNIKEYGVNLLLRNKSVGQTVLKNSFWLTFSLLISRLIKAVIVIYAARVLGVAGYGIFAYAVSIAGFVTIFSDIGISWIFVREVVRNPENRPRYVSTIFFMKLTLLVILAVLIFTVAPQIVKVTEAKALLPLVALLFIFDNLREFGFFFVKSLERMELEAGVNLLTNTAIVIAGFVLIIISPTPYNLILSYVIGSGLGLLAIGYAARKDVKYLFSGFTATLIKPILTAAWPIAIISLFSAILSYTDILMIGWLRTTSDVGFFSAAQRPTQLLAATIPAIITASAFPALARLAKGPYNQARPFIEQILTAILFFALPLSIVGFIWGDNIVQLIYGVAYEPAIPIFRVMVASLIITFSAVIINHIILAYNLQRRLVGYVIMGIVINFGLNIYLVPRWGALGSIISTLVAQLITLGLIYVYLKMLLNINLIKRNSKILLVSVVTGLGTWGLHQLHISIYIALPATALFYLLALLVLREPLIEKVRTIFSGQH